MLGGSAFKELLVALYNGNGGVKVALGSRLRRCARTCTQGAVSRLVMVVSRWLWVVGCGVVLGGLDLRRRKSPCNDGVKVALARAPIEK